MNKLKKDFYLRDDVVQISKDLLGKVLLTKQSQKICGGIITETEAYAGPTDRASHAFGGRRTTRTEVMYAEGGISYIYLCYGIHSLFNVVTNKKEIPEAILIRAIEPIIGIPAILKRRNQIKLLKNCCIGPGKVSQALGISLEMNSVNLRGNQVWIEDHGISYSEKEIKTGTRIGVDYAGEDAKRLYRFFVW